MARKRLTGTRLQQRNRRILHRDNGICHLCQTPVRTDVAHDHPDAPQVDHLIPWEHGGSDNDTNLALSHRRCNRDKGSRLPTTPSRDW